MEILTKLSSDETPIVFNEYNLIPMAQLLITGFLLGGGRKAGK